MKKIKDFIEKKELLILMVLILASTILISLIAIYNDIQNQILKDEIKQLKSIKKIEYKKTDFNIDSVYFELKKYKVKHIDIAIAQFLYETGFGSGECSDMLCLGNNLFAMKKSSIRPNVCDGEFCPKGGGYYAYYSNWKQSVLDYALYQSHYINKNTTRKSWLVFLEKKYSKTKGYSKTLLKIIKTRKLETYKN